MTPEHPDFNEIIRRDVAHRPRDPLCVGYIRISPVNGNPQNQTVLIRDHAGYYGWDLHGMIYETVSGMKSWKNRKELQSLIDAVEAEERKEAARS